MKPFRAISIQMEWKPEYYLSEETFMNKLESVMNRAERLLSRDLPNLVVFPEDLGTLLVIAAYDVVPGEFQTFASAASGSSNAT